MDLREIRRSYERSGYNALNATARTCQDVVLDRIARSSMSRNVAIKGGVLMCAISGSKRRATQDIDLDFLSYPISDEGVRRFIEALSNVDDDIDIRIKGPIEELSQQDYKGKRVHVQISDGRSTFDTKLDLGVHAKLDLEQEERWFDIAQSDEGVSLLANSKEQMFAEKLKSFLLHGIRSTRYRDLHDMYYIGHMDTLDRPLLTQYIHSLIIDDEGMWDESLDAVADRASHTLSNKPFLTRMKNSSRAWTAAKPADIAAWLPRFIRGL